MMNRNIAPALNIPAEIKIQEPEKIILDNGIPLYILNTGQTDVMKIEIIFKAGAGENKNFLVAGAANTLIDEGTKQHTSMQIAEEFEYYGAYVQADSTSDWSSVNLFTLNKFFDNVMPLFAEIITEPIFPEQEVETYKVQNKQRLLVNNNKTDYVTRKTFNQKLFGNENAYGFYQRVEDYNELNTNLLTSFHQQNYLNGVFAIIISGKVAVSVTQTINKFFGKELNVAQQVNSKIKIFNNTPGKVHVEKKDALQSGLRIGKIVFNKTHPDFKSLSILNNILGGYFGSRLMSNIREDKGYTYGIGSALVSLQNTGYFFITTEVGVDVREAALKEIYFEVNKLQNELVPQGELDLVKNYLLGSFQRSIDGPFALADKFKSILPYNLGYEYFYEYLKLINSITPLDIQLMAQKYLDEKSMIELSVG